MSDIFKYAPEGADSLKQSLSEKGNLQWFKGLDVHIGDGKYANTITARWQTIATRPTEPATQKTVADAWAEFKFLNINSDWTHVRIGHEYHDIFLADGHIDDPVWDSSNFICTREQFEAYGREQESKQEGEKWTHTLQGENCYIKEPNPDIKGYIIVNCEKKGYVAVHTDRLRPTITQDAKQQLELYVQYRVYKYGDYSMQYDLNDYLSRRDITD